MKNNKYQRVFDARMAYETNCMNLYDDPLGLRPSKTPIRGDRMEDFACRYEVDVREMIDILPAVEKALGIEGPKRPISVDNYLSLKDLEGRTNLGHIIGELKKQAK